MKKIMLLLVVCCTMCGCGRKWEQLWGQDTRPHNVYIPLTPDQIEITIGSLNPVQWADGRFKRARYMSVWACTADDACVAIPEDKPDGQDEIVVYVCTGGEGFESVISVYNVQTAYPNATKIRVEVVL